MFIRPNFFLKQSVFFCVKKFLISLPQEYKEQFKIILLGDSGVGKTAIINRYCKSLFTDNLEPTVGMNFQQKFIEINGDTIKLAIWDTAGQEKFRTLTRQFYRNVDGAILVYDITEKNTLENLENIWIPELISSVSSSVQMILVGNKSDLKDDPEYSSNIISTEEGMNCARKNATLFVEASAKSSEGVKNAFEELVLRLIQMPRGEKVINSTINIEETNQDNNGACGYC